MCFKNARVATGWLSSENVGVRSDETVVADFLKTKYVLTDNFKELGTITGNITT